MASGCRKVQPFATMQWQHNQLSNNGNLAIYLSISREHPAAAAFSTALVARSLSLSLGSGCGNYSLLFPCMHFSISYFSHSSLRTLCGISAGLFQHRMSYALSSTTAFHFFFVVKKQKSSHSWWDLIFFCTRTIRK